MPRDRGFDDAWIAQMQTRAANGFKSATTSPHGDTNTDAPGAKGGARATPKASGAKVAPVYPLVGMCRAAGVPEPEPEYLFHPVRKWRLDYAWPLHSIAVEIDGGIWRGYGKAKAGGAHSHPLNIERDIERHNALMLFGWRYLRYQSDELFLAVEGVRELLRRAAA